MPSSTFGFVFFFRQGIPKHALKHHPLPEPRAQVCSATPTAENLGQTSRYLSWHIWSSCPDTARLCLLTHLTGHCLLWAFLLSSGSWESIRNRMIMGIHGLLVRVVLTPPQKTAQSSPGAMTWVEHNHASQMWHRTTAEIALQRRVRTKMIWSVRNRGSDYRKNIFFTAFHLSVKKTTWGSQYSVNILHSH